MRILIADDEKMARLSLHSMIEELYPGVHDCYYATNGKEAVERMKTLRPDLVFLDVKMPVMDGMEALKIIRTEYPNTVVVILSGYSDFDYARTAVEFSASDYLLKPVSLEQLKTTADRAILSVHNDRAHCFSDAASRIFTLNDSGVDFPIKQNEVFRLYLVFEDEGINGHQPGSYFASFGKSNDFGSHTLLYSFYLPSGNLCFASVTEESMTQNALFRSKIEAFNAGGNRRATILFAEDTSLKKLKELLPKLEEMSVLRYSGFLSGLVEYGRVNKTKITLSLLRFSGALRKFVDFCLNSVDTDIMTWLSVFNETPEFEEAFRTLNLAGLSDYIGGMLNTEVDTSSYSAFIKNLENYAKKHFREDNSEGVDIVETAKRYVKEHYRENFNIAVLSEYLSITPAYLSRVFHRQTGEKLIDYITKQRISEAKRILMENPRITIRRLAETVGYASEKHFTAMFLNVNGCTPAEYIKRM